MTQYLISQFRLLGTLRTGLLVLALLNTLLPVIDSLLVNPDSKAATQSLWSVFPNIVAPVMAPLLLVIILFDYIMSKVRAADEAGDIALQFRAISRIELIAMALMFLCWLPFFIKLMK